MGVEEAIDVLIPPGMSKSLRWRLAVSLSITGFFVFILWAIGTFSSFGFEGFARAGEISKLSLQIGNLQASQQAGLKITIGQEICRVYFLRETASGDAWVVFNDSLGKRQQDYADINKGERFPLMECAKQK